MDRYLMYLRKSRMDTDYEEVSVEETLSRHKKILMDFCKAKKIVVDQIYEEVVSGESISTRPKMMELLEQINTGNYAGVVCIDIERLSRGSSFESGYIMQILQSNNCKIITPYKTYDLQNESDEQFTDMKFMFSRYELKSITKRLVRGRNQSASEGKFMGAVPPYGYKIVKLQGEKGNSLEIDETEASVVRAIFGMYCNKNMGYNAIAYALDDMSIKPRVGSSWTPSSINNILTNEVYIGRIRWGKMLTKRVVKDGVVQKVRYRNKDYTLFEGKHEPIITEEMWESARKRQERTAPSVNRKKTLSNPFSSLLFCEKCGGRMHKNIPSKAQKNRNTTPWYRCTTRGCDCRTIKCHIVEQTVLDEMRKWLNGYDVTPKNIEQTDDTATLVETIIRETEARVAELESQQNKICQLLEEGIYTSEMFVRRNSAIEEELTKQKMALSEARRRLSEQTSEKTDSNIILGVQKILDSYEQMSCEDKHSLWQLILSKITVYRSPDDEVSIKIYPKLPAKI